MRIIKGHLVSSESFPSIISMFFSRNNCSVLQTIMLDIFFLKINVKVNLSDYLASGKIVG